MAIVSVTGVGTSPSFKNRISPNICHDGWAADLLLLGFPPAVIDDLEKAIAEGVDADVQGPYCLDCGRQMPYWENEDSAGYVVEKPLEDYIGRRFETDAASVGKGLRKAVVKVYGPNCFACNQLLKRSEVTIDHIMPIAKGGKADIFNLQPLCKACNEEKADHPPLTKNITLHFPSDHALVRLTKGCLGNLLLTKDAKVLVLVLVPS